jgi:hypothetical protein
MARRFGRNQKRHLREAAANANAARVMAEGLAKYAVDRKARIEDELDRTRRILGENSSLLSPRVLSMARARHHGERDFMVRKVPQLKHSLARMMDADGRLSSVQSTIQDIPIPLLLADAQRSLIDGAMHVRLRYGNGAWGYGITREAIHMTPLEDLTRMISEELGYMIAAELKRELRR